MPAPSFKTVTVTVTSGQAETIPLPAPAYGVLNRLFVGQTTGSADGFTFELFTSEEPAGDSIDNFSDVEDDEISPGAFEVLPLQTVASASTKLNLFEKNYGYITNEYLLDNAVRRTTLYAKLTAAGSGPKTFDISYLIMPPAGESY